MDASETLTPAVGPALSNKRGWAILAVDILVLFLLLNYLPFDDKANAGLALMVFIGVLWLTEAIHVTITALCIPILAVLLGLMNTGDALKSFANPIIFLFFGDLHWRQPCIFRVLIG